MNKTWLEFFSTVLRTFLPLLALRLLRRWNQSGQKYAGAPDISSFFLAPEWQVTLWSLGIYNTYLLLWRRIFDSLRHVRMPTSPAACLSAIVCAESLQFKMIFAWNEDSEAVHAMFNTNFLFAWLPWQGTLERDLVSQARWAYFWIGASAIVVIVLGRTRTLHLGIHNV
jgi:ethanolaminephosphotransferase